MHYHISLRVRQCTLTYLKYLEVFVFQKWVDMRVLVDRHVRDSCGGKLLINNGKDLSKYYDVLFDIALSQQTNTNPVLECYVALLYC